MDEHDPVPVVAYSRQRGKRNLRYNILGECFRISAGSPNAAFGLPSHRFVITHLADQITCGTASQPAPYSFCLYEPDTCMFYMFTAVFSKTQQLGKQSETL